jgi:hypothetical protein
MDGFACVGTRFSPSAVQQASGRIGVFERWSSAPAVWRGIRAWIRRRVPLDCSPSCGKKVPGRLHGGDIRSVKSLADEVGRTHGYPGGCCPCSRSTARAGLIWRGFFPQVRHLGSIRHTGGEEGGILEMEICMKKRGRKPLFTYRHLERGLREETSNNSCTFIASDPRFGCDDVPCRPTASRPSWCVEYVEPPVALESVYTSPDLT